MQIEQTTQSKQNLHFWICLIGIFCLGAFLRLFWLTQVPNGLNRDEMVMGYDAYCILKTGKDMWGQWFPFFFRGIDGYQPGIFIYSTVLNVFAFGNTDFAIRFTPFIYGILTLLSTFLLTRQIVFKFSAKNYIALWVIFFLAISPWHIQYSRFGNPNILIPFFNTLGLYFFFKGINETKKGSWLIAAVVFGLSFHSYYVSYIFIPLALLGLLLLFFKEIWQHKKVSFFCLVILFIFLIPHIYHALYGNILNRSNVILFLQKEHSFIENLVLFFKNYFFLFSPTFLFEKGYQTGGEWMGKHGILYWMEIPFLLIGIFKLLFSKDKKQLYLLWWLLIYPIPASLTGDSNNLALRSSVSLPVFQIITGIGAWHLFHFLFQKKKQPFFTWIRPLFIIVFIVALLLTLTRFSHKYFFKYPYKYAPQAQYGMKEMARYVRDHQEEYDRIVISGFVSDTARRRPMIFLAYYLPIDPTDYQTKPKSLAHESIVVKFDKYEINYRKDLKKPKPGERVLYVVEEWEWSDAKVHKRIYYPNKKIVYKICELTK